jgi:hypothetical protein
MASKARRRGSPEAPAGQPAAGNHAAAEPGIDADDSGSVTNMSETTSPCPIVVENGPGPDQGMPTDDDIYQAEDTRPVIGHEPGLEQDRPTDDDMYPADETLPNQPASWPVPPPMPRADGWDADSTAAWNPASAWAEEDAGGDDAGGEDGGRAQWDEVPDWEGEIVTWEGPAQVPALVQGELTGAPTHPPGYLPDYLPPNLPSPLPARRSAQDAALGIYAGQGTPPRGVPIYDRKGAPRPKRENAPWRELVIITAVAVIVSAVILAVTTAERNNVAGLGSLFGSTGTSSPTASTLTAGAAKGHSTALSSSPSKSHTASTTAAKKPTPATLGAKSLPVTVGVAQSLVKSWLATNPGGYGIGLADVAGTVPKEVYYAVQPSTGTYWAVAAFKPSPALLAQSSTQTGQEQLAQFQDSLYAFSWQAGPVWTLLGEFSTGSCPDIWVPRAVLATWGLCGL